MPERPRAEVLTRFGMTIFTSEVFGEEGGLGLGGRPGEEGASGSRVYAELETYSCKPSYRIKF